MCRSRIPAALDFELRPEESQAPPIAGVSGGVGITRGSSGILCEPAAAAQRLTREVAFLLGPLRIPP
eukprot:15442265-Alexandrium_andersonii.AAC.1